MGHAIDFGQVLPQARGHVKVNQVADANLQPEWGVFQRQVQLDFAFVVDPTVAADVLQAFDQGAADAAHEFALDAFAFEAVFSQHHEGIMHLWGQLSRKTEEDATFTTVRSLVQGGLQRREQVLWSCCIHDSSAKVAK